MTSGTWPARSGPGQPASGSRPVPLCRVTGQVPNRVSKTTLLAGIKTDLVNIARTARSIEDRDGENGFAVPYRATDVPSEIAVTTNADAVLGRLEDKKDDPAAALAAKAALRARFTAFGLAADFVARLRADRDAITNANKHNQSENQDGVENTELIDQLLSKINGSISHLDTVAHNIYSHQPEKLRAWLSASHVERAAHHAAAPAPAPAPTPAAPATPAK